MHDPYSHRAVRRIAIPMIISSITAPLLGMVDTGVMGHLDDPIFLAAVAAGAIIFTVVFMGLNFLRMGTTGITAQAFGAGDNDQLRNSLGQPLLVAGLLALLILVFRNPLLQISLELLSPSPEVSRLAGIYFGIRIWSAPFSLLNFVMIGWLLGMQNARGPLVIMLVTNLTNITLDLFFVLLLGMTTDGVALATVLAELTGTMTAVLFVRHELRFRPGSWVRSHLVDPAQLRRLFSVNANLFLRTMALMFVFAFITARGARMGNAVLAANALLMNFQLFQSYALDGIAYAAEALVGKAVGAGNREGIRLAVRRTMQWSILFALGFLLVYAIAGSLLIDVLTDIDELRATARIYLPWLIISPIISVWSFLYDGVYVGATRSREMMLIMVGSALLVFMPAWYFSLPLGNHGLWLAFTAFMLSRALGMHYWYRHLMSKGQFSLAT